MFQNANQLIKAHASNHSHHGTFVVLRLSSTFDLLHRNISSVPLRHIIEMGNAPITIGIRTEKIGHQAGDRVNGTVYVNITQNAQAVRAILLRFEGQEHALVHYTTRENYREGNHDETRVRDHYDKSNNTFLNMEHPLQSFPQGQILPGQYEFPFSIKLPYNLPSSMVCQNGQSKCSVEYKLTATFDKPSTGLFSSNPSSVQELKISATPPVGKSIKNTSLMLPVEVVPVVSCCCDNKGSMVLQAQLDKTIVKPHDTILVSFRCQNDSSVKVKQVRVQLQSSITWQGHTGSHSERVTRVLDRWEMDATQLPELAKRKSRRQDSLYNVEGDFPYDTAWRQAAVQVPGIVDDSYSGHSIQVRYLVSVHLLTNGCCTNDVDATAMVQVFQSLPPNANVAMVQGSSPRPSAPSSVYDEYTDIAVPTAVSPSAPPFWKDDDHFVANDAQCMTTGTATPLVPGVCDASPMVQAQVLPPNWSAQAGQMVDIPMAEAWVMESVYQVSEVYDE